jgi:hypothetical protein
MVFWFSFLVECPANSYISHSNPNQAPDVNIH